MKIEEMAKEIVGKDITLVTRVGISICVVKDAEPDIGITLVDKDNPSIIRACLTIKDAQLMNIPKDVLETSINEFIAELYKTRTLHLGRGYSNDQSDMQSACAFS